jgi:thioredoxin-dependent peroxiredoxin
MTPRPAWERKDTMSHHALATMTILCSVLLLSSCSNSPSSDTPMIELRQMQPGRGAVPPAVGEKALDFSLPTLGGDSFGLSGELAKGPVVIVVLRGWPGYQCPICTKQVGQFLARAEDLKAAGAQVVLIYPGPTENPGAHAKEFAHDMILPEHFSFVVDPDFAFTLGYGLRWDAPRETAYPSTFVVDKKGIVRFAKISKTHGDRASAVDVLAALATSKPSM